MLRCQQNKCGGALDCEADQTGRGITVAVAGITSSRTQSLGGYSGCGAASQASTFLEIVLLINRLFSFANMESLHTVFQQVVHETWW